MAHWPFDRWLGWFEAHQEVLSALFALSVVMFVGSALAIPVVVTRLPADYFVRPSRPVWIGGGRGVARLLMLVLKNLLGLVLLIAGIVMLVLPGQGLLSMLLGLSFLNFPGKRWLTCRIVRQRTVHRSIDWMRRRRGRAPIELP